MRLITKTRAFAAMAALAIGVSLVGCGGGGGGGTAATEVTLGGTAAAGIFKNADVKVYDATKGDTSTPLATGTTGANGQYGPFNLGANFSKPLLIVVSAKNDGSSKTDDEVFGKDVVMPTGFKMYSVVPAGSGETLTGYVTPYTNLMYEIAKNKIGKGDVDAAINQARSVVNQMTGNEDPLTSDPVNDPGMVQRLAAVSNMASGESECASGTDGERIACAVAKLAHAIDPMAADADTSAPVLLNIDQGIIGELASSTNDLKSDLDLQDLVAANTGISKDDLSGSATQSAKLLTQLALGTTVTAPDSATASGIGQAKAFFAALRSGILPYSNNAGSGFLNTEGSKISKEMGELTLATANGLDAIITVTAWVSDLLDGIQPPECSSSGFPATCTWENMAISLSHNAVNKTITWSVLNTTLTGTIVYTDTKMTMNGYVPRMTDGIGKARVGNPDNDDNDAQPLVVSVVNQGSDVYTAAIEGSIKDLDCNQAGCPPALKLVFVKGSSMTVHEPENDANFDPGKMSMDFTGTFITANYRFTGKLTANKLQANGSLLIGGLASFTGTISGEGLIGLDSDSGNNFSILVGKLEADIDGKPLGTWSWNSEADNSATNYQKSTMTFTGTTFRGASDKGLKLVLTLGQDWDVAGNDYRNTVNVNYSDSKGVSISGQTSFLDGDDVTPKSITLADGNGIKVVLTEHANSVVKKDNTVLGTISGGRIT